MFRELSNASESFLRVNWPRPPHALDPGAAFPGGVRGDMEGDGACSTSLLLCYE